MIITGAGASTGLGADGKPLAMMSQWATSLVDELKYAAQLIGLNKDMPGDQFEAALGRFVAFSEALSTVAPLHELGKFETVIANPDQVLHKFDSATWLGLAEKNVQLIRKVIHTNLYEQFGQQRVDDEAAHRAYAKLHHQIRTAFSDGTTVFFAHVTTNFDHAIEAAIGRGGAIEAPRRVLDGFGQAFGGRREPWAPNLLAYSRTCDDEAPVLHLHGAIGWYFTEDGAGIMRQNSDDPFNPDLTPALLLPDDKKDVTRFPAPLKQVWEQFEQLCDASTHIIVLGHSLNDKHLVNTLRGRGKPVAIVVYPGNDDPNGSEDETKKRVAELAERLPKAVCMLGQFARDSEEPDIEPNKLGEWLRVNAL